MTIDEAIKRLTRYEKGVDEGEPVDLDNAILLGVEALKQLQSERRQGVGFWRDRLPGETKE